MEREGVTDLLHRLSSPSADAAWVEFLARYSPLIMHVVRRFESDDGRATDCFIHACAALSDDGFRRLRGFRTDGSATFGTWLKTVVSNACIDWRRKQYGRFRPFRALGHLPELERQVFRCLYLKGMSRGECLFVLQARFPDLTDLRLSEINASLFSQLTHQQRWQAGARTASMISLDAAPTVDESPALQISEPGPGPDDHAEADEERRLLEAALQQLPPQQRLLLRMRYEQDLTLAEIARLTGQPDTNRVYRQLEAAVGALRKILDP